MNREEQDNKLVAKNAQLAWCQLTFILIALALFVDSVNGFFLSGLGIDPKLSAAYKLCLIMLILFQVGTYSTRVLAGIFSALLLLAIGPIISFAKTYSVSGFVDDFIAILKFLTPLIVFIYCVLVSAKRLELVLSYGSKALYVGFVVLLGNLILGIMGFGFSSYGSADNDDDGGTIGVKGFFFAGNEVSGVFIMLFGVVLHKLWQRGFWYYVAFIPVVLVCGLMVATKSTMLAAMLLIFSIPIVNERHRLFNLTWLKLKIMLPIISAVVLLALFIVPILETSGIWSRLVWFYQTKGIVGIILSGRDVFWDNISHAFFNQPHWYHTITGLGRNGLGLIARKIVEIDPADVYFWFGIGGLMLFFTIIVTFLRVSFLAMREPNSQWGPLVFVVNITLISVSFIAGHIFTSGMLGPLIGLLNGLAYADLIKCRRVCKEATCLHS